jgi:hypothetical protein
MASVARPYSFAAFVKYTFNLPKPAESFLEKAFGNRPI